MYNNIADKKAVDALLDFDPLDYAEKITGESYKKDESTRQLGFAFLKQNAKARKKALKANSDSYFGMSWKKFIKVLVPLGFEQSFAVANCIESDSNPSDVLELWVQPQHGLLLVVDTYYDNVNNATLAFNWVPKDKHPHSSVYRSLGSHQGCGNDKDRTIFLCNLDVREGLRFHIHTLLSQGKFISPWYTPPHLYIRARTEKSGWSDVYKEDSITPAYLNKLASVHQPLFANRGTHHTFQCSCMSGIRDPRCREAYYS